MKMIVFEDGNLLTVSEVAEKIKVSPSTIRSWVFQKKIPYTKFGLQKKSAIRFHPVRLNEWLQKMQSEPKDGKGRLNTELSDVGPHHRSKTAMDEYERFARDLKK